MTKDQILLGKYLEKVVEDLQLTATRYEIELVLRESKGTWVIVPLVEHGFTYPDWLIDERDKLPFLKEIL